MIPPSLHIVPELVQEITRGILFQSLRGGEGKGEGQEGEGEVQGVGRGEGARGGEEEGG